MSIPSGTPTRGFPFGQTSLPVIALIAGGLTAVCAHAQAPVYNSGKSWGTVSINALKEASGLAASWRNPGVLWTHNDGAKRKIYGITPSGTHIATFEIAESAGDIEDIAVGPGPIEDVSYLYIGDIGGNDFPGDVRNSVRILRVPEPSADPTPVSTPPSSGMGSAEVITLIYPDGSYDAEALFVDPATADLYLFSKTAGQSRVYRASLNALAGGSSAVLTLVTFVSLSQPSAADISRDGSQIIVRNENAASLWFRAPGSTVVSALLQSPRTVPVIGTPVEPNGEAVAFLGGGSGYMTLSEEANPVLYHFQAQVPMAPAIHSAMQPVTVFTGGSARFSAPVSGFPQPSLTWRRNGEILAGQTGSTLFLSSLTPLQSGTYELTATNSQGTASAAATLTVRPRPIVRITEVQSEPANGGGADWWELTNFESVPVDLSGWRFNDDGGDLDNAFVFPAGLTIAPGESIVFVESFPPAQFRAWWGPGIQADTQIVSYSGGGLALGAGGDAVRVWDAGAVVVSETVAAQSFGSATEGVSFSYDPAGHVFGGLSTAGVNGAFVAATGDTGSPGIWLPPAAPAEFTAAASPGTLRLRFQTSARHWYTLETSDDLTAGSWTPQTPFQATANGPGFLDLPMSARAQFFRLRIR